MNYHFRLSILFTCLFLYSCASGDFGTFSPDEERKTSKELITELESFDLEEVQSRAESGHGFSQNDMGLFYAFGIHVEEDFEEAVSWWETAADQENFIAMYNLGIAHLKGLGSLSKDQIEAHKWLNLAYARAYRSQYRNGSGPILQLIKSIEYYWFWTVRGKMSEAQALAEEWIIEKHGSLDAVLPQDWLRKAEGGDAIAQFKIGEMYHRGEGVPQNNIQAYKWFTLCRNRETRAPGRRDMLATRMTKEDIEEGEQLAGAGQ